MTGPDEGELLELLISRIRGPFHELPPDPGIYTFVNPYSYLVFRKDPELLRHFDGIHVDGRLLVQALQTLAGVRVERASFDLRSVAAVAIGEAERMEMPIYLVGGALGEVAETVANLHTLFPRLRIAGARHGFFVTEPEREAALSAIVEAEAPMVIVGMGTPRQEAFLVDLQARGWSGLGYTCGGFLTQTAERPQYYPRWVDALELRWLYRMVRHPHVLGRVMADYPRFLPAFVSDVRALRRHRPGALNAPRRSPSPPPEPPR